MGDKLSHRALASLVNTEKMTIPTNVVNLSTQYIAAKKTKRSR